MAKFRPIVTVEAERYEAGMEDGFISVTDFDLPGGYVSPIPQRASVPYIQGPKGLEYPQEGDWIVTGHNGNRFVVRPDEFEKHYEPVG